MALQGPGDARAAVLTIGGEGSRDASCSLPVMLRRSGRLHHPLPSRGAAGARRPGRVVLVGLALGMLAYILGGHRAATFVPASPWHSEVAIGHAASARVGERGRPQPRDVAQAAGGIQMMLGIPKVAYRIPGAQNAEWVDIYNRLYRERIVFIGKAIDDQLANQIIGVLLYLDSEDSSKPIYLYINSPGGDVLAGLAIYDTMRHIKSPVVTINVGLAASMASFLLAAGEKGTRMALPHSRVMVHQAMGGAQGQAEDIKVEAQRILKIQESLVESYASLTGRGTDEVREDLQRDRFMSAAEAVEYGIVDKVIQLKDLPEIAKEQVSDAAEDATAQANAVPTEEQDAPVETPPEIPEKKPDDDDEEDTKAV